VSAANSTTTEGAPTPSGSAPVATAAFWRGLSPRLVLSAIPVILFILVAVFGPMVVQFDHISTSIGDRLLPPGSMTSSGNIAWLGTDQVGRDLLAQVIQGTRISILVGVLTIVGAGVVGSLVGIISGFAGGVVDTFLMRLADIQLAFPSILLAILIAAVIGPSVTNVIITLAVTRWVIFARVSRGSALAAKEREFVDAARVQGASALRLLTKYIFPSTLTPLLVVATVQFGFVIIAEASLSFLGLGTPPAQPSWGLTIANGRDHLATAWWIATMPGIALGLLMVSVGMFGDELRDHLDPNLRGL
jgi:peptide/nickel transport system permease protein